MPKCKQCGKSGIFLKLSKDGYCNECISQNITPSKRCFMSEDDYMRGIQNFPINSNKYSKDDFEPLSSTEQFFMARLNRQPYSKPVIARYWYFDYYFDYKRAIRKYFAQKLIVLKKKTLLDLKNEELKNILSIKDLSVKGKKAELVNRIEENISVYGNLLDDILEYYYSLTDTGEQIVNNLIYSATFDIEFEDKCLSLIKDGNLNEAYKTIAERKANSPGNSGINMNWSTISKKGLTPKEFEYYNKIYTNSSNNELFNICLVFTTMLGNPQKVKLLLERLSKQNNTSIGFDISNR